MFSVLIPVHLISMLELATCQSNNTLTTLYVHNSTCTICVYESSNSLSISNQRDSYTKKQHIYCMQNEYLSINNLPNAVKRNVEECAYR